MKNNTNSRKTITQVVALAAVLALPSLALADNAEVPTHRIYHVVVQQDRADLAPAHVLQFNAVDGQPIRN
jgi:hypothetical protein